MRVCSRNRALRKAYVEIEKPRLLDGVEGLENPLCDREFQRERAGAPQAQLLLPRQNEGDLARALPSRHDRRRKARPDARECPDREDLLVVGQSVARPQLRRARKPDPRQTAECEAIRCPDDAAAPRDDPRLCSGANERHGLLRSHAEAKCMRKRAVVLDPGDAGKGAEPPCQRVTVEPDETLAEKRLGDRANRRHDRRWGAAHLDGSKREDGRLPRPDVEEREPSERRACDREEATGKRAAAGPDRARTYGCKRRSPCHAS